MSLDARNVPEISHSTRNRETKKRLPSVQCMQVFSTPYTLRARCRSLLIMPQYSKIVLAYSGGLDTSVILKWLQERYDCEVITFTADLGQQEDLASARQRAQTLGIRDIRIADLRETFARDYIFPMLRSNPLYEGQYLLGTAIARPLIAAEMVKVAQESGADAIAHGATGKGNDQIRFELATQALNPDLGIVAPWREWDINSRTGLLSYAKQHGIEVEQSPDGGVPYSMDANLLHISYEGGVLENPDAPPPADMWRWTTDPQQAPDEPQTLRIAFENGDPVSVDGEAMGPAALMQSVNAIAAHHGIGRVDMVENRYLGLKSRGCYETPGGTVLMAAHRAVESLTLDREVAHLKEALMHQYATLVYNGYWFSPEREALQQMIDHSQREVCGEARLRLYKGSVTVEGRRSPCTRYDPAQATFEDDQGRFNQADATGFIRLSGLRLRARTKK